MRQDVLRTSTLMLVFAGSIGLAAAQQSPPADAQQAAGLKANPASPGRGGY